MNEKYNFCVHVVGKPYERKAKMNKKLLTYFALGASLILIGGENSLYAEKQTIFNDEKDCEAVNGFGNCRVTTPDEAQKLGICYEGLGCCPPLCGSYISSKP